METAATDMMMDAEEEMGQETTTTTRMDEGASTTSSTAGSCASALSGTTEELFRIWLNQCTTAENKGSSSLVNDDKLRTEARRFFRSLVRSTHVQVVTTSAKGQQQQSPKRLLSTKASHEQALAVLVQQLGEALGEGTTSQQQQQPLLVRIRALGCLRGALEGCGANADASLSLALVRLLGNFWLQHCSPIADQHDNGVFVDQDDHDEQLRDEAVQGLAALLRCPIQQENEEAEEALRIRLGLAQSGVQRRCAERPPQPLAGEQEVDEYHPQPEQASSVAILGLSVLPRSRRSLCFQLVQSAVDAVGRRIQTTTTTTTPSREGGGDDNAGQQQQQQLRLEMVRFASFAARCLHGESDPRCLLQLLQLLQALVVNWRPYFSVTTSSTTSTDTSTTNSAATFPVGDLFDAVAPYYPIQFTPPPNDVYGITRAGLQSALLDILCCDSYDPAVKKAAAGNDDGTMLHLALGIILERLVPPAEDEPATVTDWKEGLQDLDTLLLQSSSSTSTSTSSATNNATGSPPPVPPKPRLAQLNPGYMQQVSVTLLAVHYESSNLATATTNTNTTEQALAKQVAEQCRDLVARIALETERQFGGDNNNSNNNHQASTALWDAFVGDTLAALASKMVSPSSSGAEGRIAIAYAACLCSSGGSKTLRRCLAVGLETLLKRLQQQQEDVTAVHGSNNLATVVYGIGAFFSSTRVALEKAKQEGVVLVHPHPLEPYTGQVLDQLLPLLLVLAKTDHTVVAEEEQVQMAALQALESILVVCPANQYSPEQVERIVQVIQAVVMMMMNSPQDGDGGSSSEWKSAGAKWLGRILGKALDNSGSGNDEDPTATATCLQTGAIRSHLADQVLPRLISGAASSSSPSSPGTAAVGDDNGDECHLLGRQALALASTGSLDSASRIVQPLVQALKSALVDCEFETARVAGQTLGILFHEKGSYAARAFHSAAAAAAAPGSTDTTPVSPLELLSTLASSTTDQFLSKAQQREDSFRMEVETAGRVQVAVETALSVASGLAPAYRYGAALSSDQFDSLVDHCTSSLPPLTVWVLLKCSIDLSILSAALSRSDTVVGGGGRSSTSQLVGLQNDLVDLALGTEFPDSTRSSAGDCLYWIVLRHSPEAATTGSGDCGGPIESLIADKIITKISAAMENTTTKSTQDDSSTILSSSLMADCFSVVSLLGLASAKRGGKTAPTADKVIRFLVDLACTGKSTETFGGDPMEAKKTADLSRLSPSVAATLSVRAASALGSILSSEGGGLWKQRCTHIASKRIQESWDSTTELTDGMLVAVCHVVCGVGLGSMSASDQERFARVILRGLESSSSRPSSLNQADAAAVAKLVLVSLVKLMSVAPTALKDFAYPVITGSMRAYATADNFGPGDALACKLLAMQTLEAATNIVGASQVLKDARAPVISILGAAMNHPSSLLRQAAVEVRNVWLLVE